MLSKNLFLFILSLVFFYSFIAVNLYVKNKTNKDPKEVVIDEFIGIFLIFYLFGTVNYSEVFQQVPSVIDKNLLFLEASRLKNFMDNYPGLVNVEANLPAPGIEWEIKVNRKQIGSDRLANSIAVISKKKNYIILGSDSIKNYWRDT